MLTVETHTHTHTHNRFTAGLEYVQQVPGTVETMIVRKAFVVTVVVGIVPHPYY